MPFLGIAVCLSTVEFLEVDFSPSQTTPFLCKMKHIYSTFKLVDICHDVTRCTFPYSISRASEKYIISIKYVKPPCIRKLRVPSLEPAGG